MKAIAIVPGEEGSLHLRDVARPELGEVPDGRGVRVGMLRVGLCGTDADLVEGRYGAAPDGEDHLVIGHESLGRVLELRPSAAGRLAEGQLVVVTIRRPGDSVYDRTGRLDLSTDEIPVETGIARHHGLMTEEVVVDAEYVVPVPDRLEEVAVLTEPLSCVVKALRQAEAAQSRLAGWEPGRALVTGAGTIGLLATLVLRQRGLEVATYARRTPPYLNSHLVEATGARYVCAAETDLATETERHGRFDLVFESSGASQLFEPAALALAGNGVLALFSVTPRRQVLEVDVAGLNQAMVLGNRAIVGSSAASWDDYAEAVATLDRAAAEPAMEDWLARLITTRITGLDPDAIAAQLSEGEGIKATVEIDAAGG